MKIIHISDLHLGGKSRFGKDLNRRFGILRKKIVAEQTPAEDYVIMITGDLVENASTDGAYENALRKIKTLESAGYRVLVIPGNHDYGDGKTDDRKFIKLFKKDFFGNENEKYPRTKIIDGVAFIGLDSMANAMTLKDSDGKLGKTQIDALDDLLKTDPEVKRSKKVVCLHHHPFLFPKISHGLRDSRKFKKVVKGKIDALLFGHNHLPLGPCGRWDIPLWSNPGSSTQKEDYLPGGQYAVFDIDNKTEMKVTCDFEKRAYTVV